MNTLLHICIKTSVLWFSITEICSKWQNVSIDSDDVLASNMSSSETMVTQFTNRLPGFKS